MVGGRTERWMQDTWNRQVFVLLPYASRVSLLASILSVDLNRDIAAALLFGSKKGSFIQGNLAVHLS